jgi:hypothetical protein
MKNIFNIEHFFTGMVTQKLLAVSNDKKEGNNSTINSVSSEENLTKFDEKVVDFDENLIGDDSPTWKPFAEKYNIDNIFKKRLFSTANNESGKSAETGSVKESETGNGNGNGNGNENAKNGTRPFEFAEPMIFDQVLSYWSKG